jgi:hypothetical protein
MPAARSRHGFYKSDEFIMSLKKSQRYCSGGPPRRLTQLPALRGWMNEPEV